MKDYYDYCSMISRNFKHKPKPTTLHRRTCPICDANNVNIYYSVQLDRYVCKACMDKLVNKNTQEIRDMSFARKMKRKPPTKGAKLEGVYCCGFPMELKTIGNNEIVLYCRKCGREKGKLR